MQTKLSDEIMQLSVAERIQLAEDIWDSIVANQQSIGLTTVQKAALQERLADYTANPEGGAPWDTVRERIRQSL